MPGGAVARMGGEGEARMPRLALGQLVSFERRPTGTRVCGRLCKWPWCRRPEGEHQWRKSRSRTGNGTVSR